MPNTQPSSPTSIVVDVTRSPYACLRPLPVSAVRFDADGFWGKWDTVNRTSSLNAQWEQLWVSGRMRNFQATAGLVEAPIEGNPWDDTDLYKWLEAAAWALVWEPEGGPLKFRIDEGVAILTAAQRPDARPI